MVTDKCVYCRAGIRSCSFGPGRMQCSSCGGKFDTPMDLYSAQRYAETASDGSHILQVYDDPTYGVSVVAVNGYGEYVYGRGYNPSIGLWVGGTYEPSLTALAKHVAGPLVLDNAGVGDIKALKGPVASRGRKAGRRRRWHAQRFSNMQVRSVGIPRS